MTLDISQSCTNMHAGTCTANLSQWLSNLLALCVILSPLLVKVTQTGPRPTASDHPGQAGRHLRKRKCNVACEWVAEEQSALSG